MNGARFEFKRAALLLMLIFPLVGAGAPLILAGKLLPNDQAQFRWLADTNYSYRLENSATLAEWFAAVPPLAAPTGGGLLTNIVTRTARRGIL